MKDVPHREAMIMRYEPGAFDPNLRVPIPTASDRIVWIIVGYWLNILGPLFVWLRWRKKNSFIGKMAVRWALLGTALDIITLVALHVLS